MRAQIDYTLMFPIPKILNLKMEEGISLSLSGKWTKCVTRGFIMTHQL